MSPPPRKWTDADTALLRAMRSEGCSVSVIAATLHARYDTVVKRTRALNIPIVKRLVKQGEREDPRDAAGPLKDNLPACDERWRTLLGVQTYTSVRLKPSLLTWRDDAAPAGAREIA